MPVNPVAHVSVKCPWHLGGTRPCRAVKCGAPVHARGRAVFKRQERSKGRTSANRRYLVAMGVNRESAAKW